MEVTEGVIRTLLHSGFTLPVLLGNWSLRLPGRVAFISARNFSSMSLLSESPGCTRGVFPVAALNGGLSMFPGLGM